MINATLMEEIEMNGFELQFGCKICEPANQSGAYSFNFDNVCVDVVKNTTSTTSVDYSKVELNIWPNPTDNRLYFDYNKELNPHTVSIYSNLGEQVSEYRLRNNMKYIDVSDLPGSLYFFCVKDKNGNILVGERFIKI